MSIEELATLLGQQIAAAQADAWDEGFGAGLRDSQMFGVLAVASNPYRKLVDA